MNTAKTFQFFLVLLGFITTPLSIAEEAVDIKFAISKFVVEGDNPLGEDALDLLKSYLGEHVGLDRLSAATEELVGDGRREAGLFQNARQLADIGGVPPHMVVLQDSNDLVVCLTVINHLQSTHNHGIE